jgi:flagellar export protein FliJ
MNKKFKFSLEGLRKLREFKEQKAKIELGLINKEINKVNENIDLLNEFISVGYQSQEEVLIDGAKGALLHFYPLYTEGLHAHIQRLKSDLEQLQLKQQAKIVELHGKMGEAKLINKLKDNEKEVHKKEFNKKMNQEREDLFIISNQTNIKKE